MDSMKTLQAPASRPVFEANFPWDRPLSWEDLQSIPDDRHWAYEIVEGQLLVSPSRDSRHQTCVLELAVLLHAACPKELEVIVSPFDFVPRDGYSLQPDVLVVDKSTVESRRTVAPPVLAVEVISPSSRLADTSLKRLVYEEHAVASYWIIDPEPPSLLALDLVDGRYVERGFVTGEQAYDAERPFPVSVVPARLVAE